MGMDDSTIWIAISGEEREFIAKQIASGNYSDEKEVFHAGLALLEREMKIRELREMIAVADEQFERGEFKSFSDKDDLTQYIIDNAEALR